MAATTAAATGTGAGILAGATSYLSSASVATSGAAMLSMTAGILVSATTMITLTLI